MNNNYELINRIKLIKILNKINQSLDIENYSKFIEIWTYFINKYANDNIMFQNNSFEGTFNECFPLEYSFSNLKFSIWFDISRILANINNRSLNFQKVSYNNIKHDFYFTEFNIQTVAPKQSLPILIYFPGFKDNKCLRYATIDGNHRINYYVKNEIHFYLNILSATDLKMHYFSNLNSWIAYHLISGYYYALESTPQNFFEYLSEIQNLLMEAELILSRNIG